MVEPAHGGYDVGRRQVLRTENHLIHVVHTYHLFQLRTAAQVTLGHGLIGRNPHGNLTAQLGLIHQGKNAFDFSRTAHQRALSTGASRPAKALGQHHVQQRTTGKPIHQRPRRGKQQQRARKAQLFWQQRISTQQYGGTRSPPAE